MRAFLVLIDDLSRPYDQPKAVDAVLFRRPGWIWVGGILFGIAFWTGVGFGFRALVAAL